MAEGNGTFEAGEPAVGGSRSEIADAQFDELQRASEYKALMKSLTSAGIGSVVFGLIAMAAGFGNMEEEPLNVVLGLIGLFLTVEGIWIILAPSPIGTIVDGVALVVVGIWNIWATVGGITSGGGGVDDLPSFAVFGVFQIGWGCKSLWRYTRFLEMRAKGPLESAIKMIDGLVKDITESNVGSTPNLIEFQAQAGFRRAWRGRLSPGSAVFVQGSGTNLMFVKKDKVQIEEKGKALIGQAIRAEFKLGDGRLFGTILPESLGRYEAWKNQSDDTIKRTEGN